jgi:aspartokinase-like uncharacterized kinase
MRRVVKVGGSLLDREDFPRRLIAWWKQQSEGETLMVVGGGELINAIRVLDQIHPLDPEETHWLCVDLLDATFRLMSHWFSWPTITSESELQKSLRSGFCRREPTLVAVRSFYHRENQDRFEMLPANWQTTTDSIAAALAGLVAADELVILKSCEIDSTFSADELSARGILDEAFPRIAAQLKGLRVERLDLQPASPS